MKLILASNNSHKLEEIQSLLPKNIKVISLREAGIEKDIPEPFPTLQENASTKARTIFDITGQNCFGEDTGLEVYALNMEPGVKSARYAENEPAFNNNIEKLLASLANEKNRKARFRTVICLILEGKEYFFEGICEGEIMEDERGMNGFGYDPVFKPAGSGKVFAEMKLEEKNLFSHRAKAIEQLVAFLKQSI